MPRLMPLRLASVALALASALAVSTHAGASAIGQTIASRIDVDSYRHYLDDVLYTHNGHNKGLNGAQHDPCRDNIVAAFQSFGLTVELHPFTYLGNTYYNVVATKLGTSTPTKQYIIGAHFDTVNNPGADDDASGVASLVEIARVLSQFQTQYTVKFIAFDREEQGKIGSTAYVTSHAGDQILAMVQLDMIAHDVGSNRENMYGNAAAAPLKAALAAAAALYGDGLTVADAGNATFSDHAPFAAAGYQAIAFVEHLYTQFGCYHQPCDSVDTPNYIHYPFACRLVRTVAGYVADKAGAYKVGDITGEGVVDFDDVLAILAAWGRCPAPPEPCLADLDSNGTVDFDDVFIVLQNWS